MKKLLILSALILVLGITGCETTTDLAQEETKDVEVLVGNMEEEAEDILKEEAHIEEDLIELDATVF